MTKLTQQYIKEAFDYDAETGQLNWSDSRPDHHFIYDGKMNQPSRQKYYNELAGKKAGTMKGGKGYRVVTVAREKHRVMDLIVYLIDGYLPASTGDMAYPLDYNPMNQRHDNIAVDTPENIEKLQSKIDKQIELNNKAHRKEKRASAKEKTTTTKPPAKTGQTWLIISVSGDAGAVADKFIGSFVEAKEYRNEHWPKHLVILLS